MASINLKWFVLFLLCNRAAKQSAAAANFSAVAVPAYVTFPTKTLGSHFATR
jgi:hypothetical protein